MRDIYESDWNGVEELPVITEVSLGEIYVGEIYRRDLSSHSLTVGAFGLLELLEKKKISVAIITHPTGVAKEISMYKNI